MLNVRINVVWTCQQYGQGVMSHAWVILETGRKPLRRKTALCGLKGFPSETETGTRQCSRCHDMAQELIKGAMASEAAFVYEGRLVGAAAS